MRGKSGICSFLLSNFLSFSSGFSKVRARYTKRQRRQLSDDARDTGPIENNGVVPEWVATHFQVTPFFSMRTV